MKNSSNGNGMRISLHNINREISKQEVQKIGEPDESLAGRATRVTRIFGAIRPLLLALTAFPILPPASRTAVTVLVQSLDALSIVAAAGDTDDTADFKAGRDL